MSALEYDGADDDASYDNGLFSKLMARMAMQEEEEENAVPRNPRTWPSVDQSDNWLTKPYAVTNFERGFRFDRIASGFRSRLR